MSTKLRPQNGPGSNGLRGGLNTYSPKTTTGQWLEEYGGTSRYKRGFTTQDFQTEAQHAQTGAQYEKLREYGAGLPMTEVVVRKPVNADVFNPSNDKSLAATRFQSNSQLMNVNIYNKHMADEALLTPNLPRDKLEVYRKNWTCDTEAGRLMRFQTESRLAGNCANNKFQVHCLRLLPGAPKSLEEYRARIVDRFGVFAIAALKTYVGKGDVSIQQLRGLLNKMRVDIKTFEFNQIVAYVTASPSTISTEDVVRTLRGKMDGFDANAISAIYSRLNGNVSLVAAQRILNTSKFPEVLEGFKEFAGAYSRDGRTLSESEFLDLHEDMYVSLPGKFNEIVQSIWEV